MSKQFLRPKDPDDIDDFTVAFTLASGETISSKTVTATGGTVDSSSISGSSVVARISGGTVNTSINVLYRITTSLGRQLDLTGVILVRGN